MKKLSRYMFCLAAVILLGVQAPVVLAGEGHGKGHAQGHGKGKNKEHGRHKGHNDDISVGFRFSDHDRGVIQKYLSGRFMRNCPPGLAKKRNGCLPPGQAKKYRVGYPLAGGLGELLPESLLMQLGPVPHGYQYMLVDKDVLLISEAGHKVIDAITLLSAVGK